MTDKVKSLFPILEWAPKYNMDKFGRDLIAGFTVGLTVIPQGLAYSALAGLPVQYGLYSSFMGSFLYTFLGTSKDITLGPTAIMALLISEYTNNPYSDTPTDTDPVAAVALSMITAIVLMIMAVFRIGFLVNFIPHCVIVGFCCAASIIISSSQVKHLLGLTGKIPKPFFEQWKGIISNISSVRWQDCVMGFGAVIILHLLKEAKTKFCNDKQMKEEEAKPTKIARKTLWFVSTARNAIVVIFATIITFLMINQNPDLWSAYNKGAGFKITGNEGPDDLVAPLKITGKLKEGLPPLAFPKFTRQVPMIDVTSEAELECWNESQQCSNPHHLIPMNDLCNDAKPLSEFQTPAVNSTRKRRSLVMKDDSLKQDCDGTYKKPYQLSAGELIGNIGSGMAIIPMMAFLESIAIAKGFAKKFEYKVDAGQELIAISVCCFATSLVSGFPVTGSFSRSAVNAASNVATPAGGLVTGIMVLLAAAYLSPVFFFIPKSALSAVIFLAAISMFDYEGAIHIYRIRKLDMLPLLVTFFLSFYEVAIGIGAGVAVSLIIMLFSHARPKIHITRRGSGKGAVVKSEQNVDYPACDYLDDKINASRFAGQEFLVIDMSNITKLDSGAAEQFAMFVKTKNCETGKSIDVYFTSARPVVRKALIRAEASIEDNIHGLSTGSLLAKLNHFDSKEERKEQARVDREEQELSDEDLGNRLFDARIEPELSQEHSENQEKPAPPAESDNLMSADKNV